MEQVTVKRAPLHVKLYTQTALRLLSSNFKYAGKAQYRKRVLYLMVTL